MRMRVSPRVRWTAVGLFAGAILLASVVPIPGPGPEEPGGIPTTAFLHFLGYGTLSGLLVAFSSGRRRSARALSTGLLGSTAYGALIECLQYVVPYRSFSYLDMAVNGAGAAVGALAALCVLAVSARTAMD